MLHTEWYKPPPQLYQCGIKLKKQTTLGTIDTSLALTMLVI